MASVKQLPFGVTPATHNAVVLSAGMAGIDLTEHPKLRYTQTIGNAVASAGFHARDGWFTLDGQKHPYCGAIDFSVLWLSIDEIRAWLDALAWWGIPAWYRPWITNGKPNYHIHAVSVFNPIKPELRRQVVDFVNDRTGLKGHATEKFYTAGREQDAYIWRLYQWSQYGGPNPGLPPKAPNAPKAEPFLTYQEYNVLLGNRDLPFEAPAIDGTAWLPIRPWFEQALGITTDAQGHQLVKWHPEERTVYVQGRRLQVAQQSKLVDVPIRLLKVNDGPRQGYAPIRLLCAFSALALTVDEKTRTIRVYRPQPAAHPPAPVAGR